MANTVKLKQSSVAGKVPATTDLALGEIAVNTYDGKLFLKKKVGTTETVVDLTAAASGVSSFNTRAGAVTLQAADVNSALGFNAANAAFSGNYTGYDVVTGAATLTTSQAGRYILCYSTGGYTVTLPSTSGLIDGACLSIYNCATDAGTITIAPPSGILLSNGASSWASIPLKFRDRMDLVKFGSEWRLHGGDFAMQLSFTATESLCPTGAVLMFAASGAPNGWMKANGAAVSRTTYATLFNVIGTTYGAGNGSTTFNLPDLRGEFLRVWDDSRGVDSRRTIGSAQGGMIQSHNHGGGYLAQGGGNAGNFWGAAGADWGAGIPYSGGSETRPRNIALLACIKY